MHEAEIILDCELEVPDSILNHIVEDIEKLVKEKGYEKYIANVYWDEV